MGFWGLSEEKSAPELHGWSALLGSALFFQNQQSKPHFCWFLTRNVGAQLETLEDNKTSIFSEFLWRINLTAHAAFDTSIVGAGCQQLLTGHLASLDVSWMQCSQTSLMFFFLFYGFTTSNTPKSRSFSSVLPHWNHRCLQWNLQIAQPQLHDPPQQPRGELDRCDQNARWLLGGHGPVFEHLNAAAAEAAGEYDQLTSFQRIWIWLDLVGSCDIIWYYMISYGV